MTTYEFGFHTHEKKQTVKYWEDMTFTEKHNAIVNGKYIFFRPKKDQEL